MKEKVTQLLIIGVLLVLLADGAFNAMIPANGFTDDGSTGHYVMEPVLNTKLATMQGQINKGFERQADAINKIGEYLERLQKKGLLPKTDEVLIDKTN